MTALTIDDLGNSGYCYSDMFKDVYGSRPRGYTWVTVEEFEADFDRLDKQWAENEAHESAVQVANLVALELRISNLIETGAADRGAAIRWLNQAEDTDGDTSYLEYKLNVPYGTLEKMLEVA